MKNANRVYSTIVVHNNDRERTTLSKHACKSVAGLRRNQDLHADPHRSDLRPSFSYDTSQVMHSHAYARYIDKTQAFYLFENDHITHRVLHVQIVSKIGRVVGRCLELNEDLIEAIALGHDLGHVPYGHEGERILNRLCIEDGVGGFSHGAQSVRLLMDIENNGQGLDLTLQVLDGILCHNGELLQERYAPYKDKGWEKFLTEHESAMACIEFSKTLRPMTMEGCVVRIADIIAYIARDIDDAATIGLLTWKDVPSRVKRVLGQTSDEIMESLVKDLVAHSYGMGDLSFGGEVFTALTELKSFNLQNIYQNPRINTENNKIKHMFESLFGAYKECLAHPEEPSNICESISNLPNEYRTRTPHGRIAADYMSGMTDDFFNAQYSAMFVPKSYGMHLEDES
jgi:dGTPase